MLACMQILKKTQEGVAGAALLECVQRRMESIALQLPAGSLEQRVQVCPATVLCDSCQCPHGLLVWISLS